MDMVTPDNLVKVLNLTATSFYQNLTFFGRVGFFNRTYGNGACLYEVIGGAFVRTGAVLAAFSYDSSSY
jgi:hypothetical protein